MTPTTAQPTQPAEPLLERELPDSVDGWLITGTQYSTSNALGRGRRVHAGFAGPQLTAVFPDRPFEDTPQLVLRAHRGVEAGVVGSVRFDTERRGIAGGIGLVVAPVPRLELELSLLRSALWGAFAGARVRLWTGAIRPYAAVGVPVFVYRDDAMSTRITVGGHLAAGAEFVIDRHIAIQLDVGVERFFDIDQVIYQQTVVVPTLAVIGRL